jgi:hypothetical protein
LIAIKDTLMYLCLVHIYLNILISFKIGLIILLLVRLGECCIAVELSDLKFQSV